MLTAPWTPRLRPALRTHAEGHVGRAAVVAVTDGRAAGASQFRQHVPVVASNVHRDDAGPMLQGVRPHGSPAPSGFTTAVMQRRLYAIVVVALVAGLFACGGSTPEDEREARRLLRSVEGVERVDTVEIRKTTWGQWREISSDDPEFDNQEQPTSDDAPVYVIGITGHVEPLFGSGSTDWGIIVLDQSSHYEYERMTGAGRLPRFFRRIPQDS